MAGTFGFRALLADPANGGDDPYSLADASRRAGAFGGIDAPRHDHLVGTGEITGLAPVAYMAIALGAGQQIRLDADFTAGNLRAFILDSRGVVAGENDDGGVTDLGSAGPEDPNFSFTPATSGVYYIAITSFDNEYTGNWTFENDGNVTGSFQLDISAAGLPPLERLGNGHDNSFGDVSTAYRTLGQGGDDRIWRFGVNNDILSGGPGIDDLRGGPGDDVLLGGEGGDYLEGGLGNDVLIGGRGPNTLDGGDGDDEIHGGKDKSYDALFGGNGNDHIFAGAGDLANGMAGDDWITGGDSAGGDGNDTLTGNGGANWLDAGSGDDSINGLGGKDTIFGGLGNDTIDGGEGRDTFYFDASGPGVSVDMGGGASQLAALNGESSGNATGQGNDSFTGIERIYLTDAKDTYFGSNKEDEVYGGASGDAVYGYGGDDRLYGDDGNDSLHGGVHNDRLFGNDHVDFLYGDDGRDILDGGAGGDLVHGGLHRDKLTGGPGADMFTYWLAREAGLAGESHDLILDFSQGEGDRIDLGIMDADTSTLGQQAFAFIGILAFSGTGGELRYYFGGGFTIVEGDLDGDGAGDFAIELTGEVNLTAGDFIL